MTVNHNSKKTGSIMNANGSQTRNETQATLDSKFKQDSNQFLDNNFVQQNMVMMKQMANQRNNNNSNLIYAHQYSSVGKNSRNGSKLRKNI